MLKLTASIRRNTQTGSKGEFRGRRRGPGKKVAQTEGWGGFNGVYFREGVHYSKLAYACLKFRANSIEKVPVSVD